MSGASRAEPKVRSCKSCGTPLSRGYLRPIGDGAKVKRVCRRCAEALDRGRRWWVRPLTWALTIPTLFAASAAVIRITLGPFTAEGLFLSAAIALIPASLWFLRGGPYR